MAYSPRSGPRPGRPDSAGACPGRNTCAKHLSGRRRLAAGLPPAMLLPQARPSAFPGRTFQEERWKTDEAAIKAALEAAGDKYISADAQSSAAKQLTDVEALIAQGANALIILAHGQRTRSVPAVEKAAAEGIPVIGYDRLIEDPTAPSTSPSTTTRSAACMAETMLAAQARRQLRLHQGRQGRSERRLPVRRASWKC